MFSIETLLEKLKPKALENAEFEYPQNNIIIKILLLAQNSSKSLSIETLMKDLIHVVLEKSEFQHPAKSILTALRGMQGS